MKKIMVIDDEALIVKALRFRLEKAGYEVAAFSDTELAMEYLTSQEVDVLVTDLLMPMHDGMVITQTAKALANPPKVIILSAAGQEKNVVDAFKLGADDFISKPFSPEELIIRIQRLL